MDELVKLLDGTLCWSLEYDNHKGVYDTIDEWAHAHSSRTDDEEAKREMEACRAAGHVWWLQVYPSTPVGFYRVYAPTFEAVLEWARELRPALEVELAMRRQP